MAWLLAMLGDNFWQFNVMELFASIAIIIGAIFAIRKCVNEQRRKNKLIHFPDEWSAIQDLPHNVLEITAFADVHFHHDSCSYKGYVYIRGEKIEIRSQAPTQSFKSPAIWYWKMKGTLPLSLLPKDTENIAACFEINLDGQTKKKSGRRILSITKQGISPSIPDKEGS